VELLLGAFERAGGFMSQPATPERSVKPCVLPTEKPGDRIGRYKLLEQIGEGGCGVVYVAEQEQPLRRRVALKIIKLGMDTKQVIARFDAERQALAMMDHPNIAKVFDAGATESGRPFFVMELIRGVKITEYCEQNQLPTRERLELFIQVCQAIQHAHQKGIIHRDIKPSNILVTVNDGVSVPKVIDFGIAKATQGRLTDQTVYTAFEQFIGTPAYMSPEQAVMTSLDIDTRTDIYSLGVLLYELLTSKTPFDAKELLAAGLDEMRRTIREVEPVKPSTRLTQVLVAADLRGRTTESVSSRRRLQEVRGDLDWIAMKCLEKDRTRRYETANGLAADIHRHINNEPVVARPPSKLYEFQKTVRRHKFGFATGTALITVLMAGIVISFSEAVRARRAEQEQTRLLHVAETAQREAQENFDRARAGVADLLAVSDEDLYDQPGMQPLRAKMMRAAIDRYKPFLDQPSPDPAPRAELARLYVKYGFFNYVNGEDYKTAVAPYIDSGIAIQKQLLQEHPDNRALREDLGWSCLFRSWRGESADAGLLATEMFESLTNANGDDALARADLAWAFWQRSYSTNGSESLRFSEGALNIREQLVKEFPRSAEFRRDLATSLQRQATLLSNENPTNALVLLTRAIDLRAGLIPELEQRTPEIFVPLRAVNSAARILRTALHWTKRDLALNCVLAARQYARLKQWSQATDFVVRGEGIYRPLVEQNPSIIQFAVELGVTLLFGAQEAQEAGDLETAQARRIRALDLLRAQFPVDAPARALVLLKWDAGDALEIELAGLARLLLRTGNPGAAEPVARQYLVLRQLKNVPDDWQADDARCLIGASLLGQTNYVEAEPVLLLGYEGLKQREARIRDRVKVLSETLHYLIQLDLAIGRPERAANWRQKLTALTSSPQSVPK
jgi:serine/threonine protein kinase